ncbi:hypothetical protein QZH41_015714 [Actinostola sp. cb2023]|nr:hypothetical protein QZH41_015714 [Actinostola sp. cb2023]
MCKEYYNRALLKQTFVKWKQKLMVKQADHFRDGLLQKRVCRLWFLRYRRKVIHRHLCKAMSRKGKKRRFFNLWLNNTQSQCKRRQHFISILHRMLLSKILMNWKERTNIKTSIRQRYEWLMQKKNATTTRKAIDNWLFAMKVANLKKQAKINWTKRCVRNACTEWKLLLKRKYLEHTLIESRPAMDFWLLRVFWNEWRKKKELADREQEHVNTVGVILTRNFKRRIFLAWRVTNQQEQIIAPTVARRERKHIARVFDAWRLYVFRQRYIVDQYRRTEEKLMEKRFLYWRKQTFLRIKERDAITKLQISKMTRAFIAWHRHIREIRRERLKEHAQNLQLLSTYFKQWSQRMEAQVEVKEEQEGLQVASLPGRIDEIHPDSPRFRSASPITLIRESNNMAHVTSPLIVETPTSSPSPSPPELHLSLPTSTTSSESVFFKDKGDLLLSRPEFERQHSSMDDDEFECMSVTSGMSSASVRDKEMVIIDTIRHWRSLPLSLTFRTWLKYTRQRKLLRELLYFAKDKKAREIMSSTFQHWTREFYITVASRRYRHNGTRLRCLRAWHVYVKTRQVNERCMESANALNRTLLLKRFFHSWQNKCDAKKKLQSIIGQWQKKAIGKTFLAWHLYSCTRTNNQKKGIWFKDQRVLSMAFREWWKHFDDQRKAREFTEVREIEFSVDIIKTWHEWATGVCTRRRLWRSYHRSLEVKTMKQIFTAWLGQVKRRESAQKFYQHSLLRSVLLSWQKVSQTAIENKMRASTLNSACTNGLLRRSFTFWHRLFIHRQLARSHVQQRDQVITKEYFKEWRDFTLKCRAEKCFINCMLKKVYYQWYDHCLARKKVNLGIIIYLTILQFIVERFCSYGLLGRRSYYAIECVNSKVLNNKAMEICQLTDKKILHQSFMYWMQETHNIQKAKQHYAINACRSSLNAWYNYAHTKVRCKKVLNQVQAVKNEAMLAESFSTWRESFLHNAENQETLDEYLHIKQVQHLQSCMLTWRKYTMNCRAYKHHDIRLIFKSFFEWRLRLSQKKGLEKVMEKVFYRRIRQAAIHWKQWTVKTRQHQAQAKEFQVGVGDHLVKISFTYWVIATEKSRRAKYQYNRTALKWAFSLWNKVVGTKVKERSIIENFQQQTIDKKVGMMFKKWHTAFKQLQKYNELVSSQMHKHNNRVLCACLIQWKKFIQKCRADKHFSMVVVARTFLDWKSHFDERMSDKDKEQVFELILC